MGWGEGCLLSFILLFYTSYAITNLSYSYLRCIYDYYDTSVPLDSKLVFDIQSRSLLPLYAYSFAFRFASDSE